jgi:hypothetical protein
MAGPSAQHLLQLQQGLPMEKFAHDLGAAVTITASGESGTVIARAEYIEDSPSYLIRYKAADGRAVQNWWSGNALQPTA